MKRWLVRTVAALLVVGATVSAWALGQPPADPQPPNPPGVEPGDAGRDHVRGMERRLGNDPETRKRLRENIQKRLERWQLALKMLDEGKSPEEVRQAIPEIARLGQRGDEGAEPGHTAPGPGGNMGQGRGGGGGEPPRALTEEEKQAVRDVLAETSPKFLADLREKERARPEEADRQYSETFSRMRMLIDLKKRDPDMFALRAREVRKGFEARDAAKAIAEIDRAAMPDTAKRQALEQSLKAALTAQFEVKTQLMQREAAKRTMPTADALDKMAKDMIARERQRLDGKRPDGERRPGAGGGGERRGPAGEPPAGG